MKNFFKLILLFIVFCSPFGGWEAYAQVYPVQLTPVFNSPYSVKLSDYATSMDTKMRLMISPTDISIISRQVRLKLYIKGRGLNIQSSDYVQGQQPIFINGGEFLTLTNTDLAALFRLENLQGISALQYANGLPEGMYDFCFEMYDFVTNQRISQKSCAMMYLQLNDPPLLNTPQKNEQIAATDFPNILFTWTPRNINATNVSYKFELKQLMDPTMDPQFAFQMSPILYEETLFGTALMYNLNMPILTPGMRYAWRVRAVSTTGLSENSVFKNDGYSEIYSFKYTAQCTAPTFLLSEAQGPTSVRVSWQGVPDHTRYQIQYKKQDVRNAQWFSTNSLNTQSLITNLEPGVTYQFRVGSSCDPSTDGIQSFTYSGVSTFTTPTQTNGVPAYNCGIIPKIDIQNQKILDNLIQSETFTAGDFPVTVLELEEQHSPYSGRGYIIVPYLADTKIAVEFKNILINTDYQLISGVVETSYNPDWKNVTDIEDFTGEGAGGQIEETVKFEIQDIVINANGDIIVNGKDGEQVTIPGGKDTVITDGNGKIYTVDSNGGGTNESTPIAEGGKSTPENTDGVDKNGQATAITAKGVKIIFSAGNSKYAFDVMPEHAPAGVQKLYKKVGDVALPYKAVLNGDTDTVLATVNVTDTTIKLDSIVFKTQNGAKVDFRRSDKTFVLTVKGNLTYAEEQILATIKQGDKWKVIGAFMLVHISPKEVNVVLVKLNGASIPLNATTDIENIYKGAGIKFAISPTVINLEYNHPNKAAVTVGDSDFFATYTPDEQLINSKLSSLSSYKNNTYYLIYSDLPASKTAIKGFMALKGQYGYVFPNAPFNTGAHELGHGALGLEHPFNTESEKGKTNFLMDYGDTTAKTLWHDDWKQINDPKFRLYLFQGDSEGEQVDKDFVLKEDGYFLTPSNKLIKLLKGTQIIFTCDQPQRYKNGALFSFKTPDGFYWHDTTKFALNETSFDGYFKADKNGWVKNNGKLISYSDSNFKYNGAGKYAVYFINLLAINSEKSEYRILKQEIQLSAQQISASNSFAGTIQDLVFKGSDGLVDTVTSTGCETKPEEERGNFVISIESKDKNATLKVYKNTITGKYIVEAELKGDGNVKTRKQKAALEKQMSALATQKINELGGLKEKVSQRIFETTDDGGGFYVKDMNGQEWLGTICDLGSNVWENAALPENYWNQDNEGFKNSTIHLPPTLSGVSDGAIGIVSDYPQLVKLGYDVATKEEVRNGIWTAVKNITPSSIVNAATGAIKDKWDKYANSKPFVTSHEVGKDGVAVVSALMGASFITGGEDALESSVKKTGDKVKDAIQKKLDDIEKYFNTKEWADRVADRFGKYKGQLTEAEWLQRYKTLYKNREIGKLTEDEFQLLEGGLKPKKGISTSDGKRYFDNVLEGTAREVKSGPVTLSKYKDQILKDIEILKQDLTEGKIKNIEWHCFDDVDKIKINEFVKQELGDRSNLFQIIQH